MHSDPPACGKGASSEAPFQFMQGWVVRSSSLDSDHPPKSSQFGMCRPTTAYGRYRHLRVVARQPVGAPWPLDSCCVKPKDGGTPLCDRKGGMGISAPLHSPEHHDEQKVSGCPNNGVHPHFSLALFSVNGVTILFNKWRPTHPAWTRIVDKDGDQFSQRLAHVI